MQPSGFNWLQLDEEIDRLGTGVAEVEGRLKALVPEVAWLCDAQQKVVAGLRAEAEQARAARTLRLAVTALALLRIRWEKPLLVWAFRFRLAPLRLGLKWALWQERRRNPRLRIGG